MKKISVESIKGMRIIVVLRTFLKIYRLKFLSNNVDIVCRTACMTNDALKLLGIRPTLNIQKGRIDFLNKKREISTYRPKIKSILFIDRNDIIPLILFQRTNFTQDISKAKFIIMDSYSELTDQLFIDKTDPKNVFLANYSDVKKKYRDNLHCKGLINPTKLTEEYRKFFTYIRRINPSIEIVFCFFPIELEKREVFINQNSYIKKALQEIENEFTIKTIHIPKQKVSPHQFDELPYHYGNLVYEYLAAQLSQILIKQEN